MVKYKDQLDILIEWETFI